MGITKKYLLIAGVMVVFANATQDAHAAFTLNFQPSADIQAGSQSNEMTYARCHIIDTTDTLYPQGGLWRPSLRSPYPAKSPLNPWSTYDQNA